MKRSVWVPLAFLLTGCAFYVYYGITYNAWKENLSNIIIYAVIVTALHFALKKKEQYADERKDSDA